MYLRYYGHNSIYADLHKTGHSSWNLLEFSFFIIHYISLIILFVLTCFADSKDKTTTQRKVTKKKDSEKTSSNGDNFELEELPMLEKSSPIISNQEADRPSPECPNQRASFLSQMTYQWSQALLLKGFRNSLSITDLWGLNPKDTCFYIAPKFQVPNNVPFGTIRMIAQNYGWYFLAGSLFKLIFDLLQFVKPQLLK